MTTLASLEAIPGLAAHPRCLVLSIKPRYVDKILAGTKTIELRRTAPDLSPGAPVLLYSSSPVKAIVGIATLKRVDERTPAELWTATADHAGVTNAEFNEYFDGAERAFGLGLIDVRQASSSVSLEQMRELGVEPPQSWRYLASHVALQFFNMMHK